MTIPELRTRADVEIVAAIAFRAPALGDVDEWNVRFGRELNATEDRHDFVRASATGGGLPVIEGKHLSPFRTNVDGASYRIAASTAAKLLPARPFDRPRLAYRDVAAATNKLTLIAAIVPAGTVTTHTVFCSKNEMDLDTQHFLCGIFNSFVANYLIRVRIHTHVGAAGAAWLPVPKPARHSREFRGVADLSASLSKKYVESTVVRLQARVARLYGLTDDQFRHVLETFPLIPRDMRHAALAAFCDIVT